MHTYLKSTWDTTLRIQARTPYSGVCAAAFNKLIWATFKCFNNSPASMKTATKHNFEDGILKDGCFITFFKQKSFTANPDKCRVKCSLKHSYCTIKANIYAAVTVSGGFELEQRINAVCKKDSENFFIWKGNK